LEHVILEKVLHGDVPTLAGPPAVAAADRVIHRALAKSPAKRYVSAVAMAEDLRTALVAEGTSEDCARSEGALNRALELNPDLSIADRFYAQLEVGTSVGHTKRWSG
jgi:hypothetical protein